MKLTIIGSVDEIKRFLGGDISAKVTIDGADGLSQTVAVEDLELAAEAPVFKKGDKVRYYSYAIGKYVYRIVDRVDEKDGEVRVWFTSGLWMPAHRLELVDQPKLTRADVVARAKRDVADLTNRMKNGENESEGNDTFRFHRTVPEFIVNRKKRAVSVLVKGACNPILYEKGIAKCAPDDVFNADIGKAIALRRALGLDVPTEYLHAPKPEGVAVGDVVQYYRNGEESFTHVVQDNRDIDTINRDNRMAIFWTAKVIDDTDREEYRSVGV